MRFRRFDSRRTTHSLKQWSSGTFDFFHIYRERAMKRFYPFRLHNYRFSSLCCVWKENAETKSIGTVEINILSRCFSLVKCIIALGSKIIMYNIDLKIMKFLIFLANKLRRNFKAMPALDESFITLYNSKVSTHNGATAHIHTHTKVG